VGVVLETVSVSVLCTTAPSRAERRQLNTFSKISAKAILKQRVRNETMRSGTGNCQY